ncbi:restriction endonuclease subunit S [Polynucleobacter asymbioticus]|jgi:type I restriction enzyme S subunit|uniref:restriction endonuclease subunit S n=1 Tax=Polynucleobacter asymbioticus TaxID=576611 RepID=UPI0008F844C0|nr:restriction endonuclease subunit S [Polynucleobacter asymbioticus]
MSEMHEVLLSELLLPLISGGRPSGGASSNVDGIPSIGGENILMSGGMTYLELKRIPSSFFRSMPKGRLQNQDVLINKDGAQTGKVGLYTGEFNEAAVNEHVFILRARNQQELSQPYLYYCILYPETRNKIERRITGSAQPGLNTQFVKAVTIPYCSIKKQERIASIISSLDESILKTESLIQKYQNIKIGLIDDFFTHGVLPSGQLRPPRSQAPELYQSTAIGWMPRDWECQTLSSILLKSGGYLQTGPFGSQLHAYEYQSEGIPVVMPQDINDGLIGIESIARISVSRASSLSRHALKVGDIIIARRGDLSRAAPVQPSESGWICGTGCFLLRLGKTELNHLFFSHVYRHDIIQRQIAGMQVGTTMPSLNNAVMGKLLFPFPSLAEQNEISKRIDAVEYKITTLQKHVKKSAQQKLGLMHDLLTGKVEVKVNESQDAKA